MTRFHNYAVIFLATFAFSGKIKPAPGTWGSLAGLIVAVILNMQFGQMAVLIFTILSFLIGIYVAEHYGRITGIIDNGEIVIDEAYAIALMVALLPADIIHWVLIFITFRFFDILKPFPIGWFDKKLKNGFGVMFDDLLAALYGLALIWGGTLLYGTFFPG